MLHLTLKVNLEENINCKTRDFNYLQKILSIII